VLVTVHQLKEAQDLSQCLVPGLSLHSPCPAPQQHYCADVKSLAVKSDVGSSGEQGKNSSNALSEGATVSMHVRVHVVTTP